MACAEQEAANYDQNDGADFCGSEKNLNSTAELDAEVVQSRDQKDDESRQRLSQSDCEIKLRNVARIQRRGHNWKEEAEKPQKSCGERGHRDWPVEKGTHPAEEKSPERAEPMIQINIRATCPGKRRAKLGIAKGTEEDDDAAKNPRNEDERHCSDCACHVARDKKNSRADRIADNDGRSCPEAKATDELRMFVWFRQRDGRRMGMRETTIGEDAGQRPRFGKIAL